MFTMFSAVNINSSLDSILSQLIPVHILTICFAILSHLLQSPYWLLMCKLFEPVWYIHFLIALSTNSWPHMLLYVVLLTGSDT